MSLKFIAIDTETGGFDPVRHALLSLAAVPSWEAEPFSVFIRPEGEIEAKAAEVNGYTPELWAERGAVSLKLAMMGFQHWLWANHAREAVALAHNAAFDQRFLNAAEKKSGVWIPLARRWRCSCVSMLTLQDAGYLDPELKGSLEVLGTVSGFWQKEARGGAHDALQDARCCLHGYQWLLSLIAKKEGAAA